MSKIIPKSPFQKLSIILITALCLLYILLIRATINAMQQYNQLQESTDTYIACLNANAQLAAGSDYLTEQARMYVVTQDEQNLQNYFAEAEETRRRERAINELAAYEANNATYDYLMAALDASNLLMQREFYAMKLTALAQEISEEDMPQSLQSTMITDEDLALSAEDMLAKAQNLVFNERYNLSKETISDNLEYAIDNLLNITRKEQQNAQKHLHLTMREQAVLLSVLVLGNALLFTLFQARRRHRQQRMAFQPSK